MAVSFLSLHNPIDNRKIREVIMAGDDNITVYEPSIEDIRVMTEFQEGLIEKYGDSNSINYIEGAEMVRVFFPLLTDIKDLEDLTTEQVQAIVEEPTQSLLQAEQVVKGIITEVYKTMMLSAKTQVLEMDFAAEGARTENQMLDSAFTRAAREMGLEKLINKVDLADKDLQEAISKSIGKQTEIHQEVKKELSGNDTGKIRVLSPKSVTPEEALEDLEGANMHLKAKNLLDQYKEDFKTGAKPVEYPKNK